MTNGNAKLWNALVKSFKYSLDSNTNIKNPGWSSLQFRIWYGQWHAKTKKDKKKLDEDVTRLCAKFVKDGVLVPFGGYRDYVYWIQRDHDIFKENPNA
jgi:hypothetical protein